MKRLINKLAAMFQMKKSTDNTSDHYTKALDELRGTPAYAQLFDNKFEIM